MIFHFNVFKRPFLDITAFWQFPRKPRFQPLRRRGLDLEKGETAVGSVFLGRKF